MQSSYLREYLLTIVCYSAFMAQQEMHLINRYT
uniref:Uncharacterized protein n=1 Tax=Setaria italica TaxID=4555 RepID=K3YFL2_SETIT